MAFGKKKDPEIDRSLFNALSQNSAVDFPLSARNYVMEFAFKDSFIKALAGEQSLQKVRVKLLNAQKLVVKTGLPRELESPSVRDLAKRYSNVTAEIFYTFAPNFVVAESANLTAPKLARIYIAYHLALYDFYRPLPEEKLLKAAIGVFYDYAVGLVKSEYGFSGLKTAIDTLYALAGFLSVIWVWDYKRVKAAKELVLKYLPPIVNKAEAGVIYDKLVYKFSEKDVKLLASKQLLYPVLKELGIKLADSRAAAYEKRHAYVRQVIFEGLLLKLVSNVVHSYTLLQIPSGAGFVYYSLKNVVAFVSQEPTES